MEDDNNILILDLKIKCKSLLKSFRDSDIISVNEQEKG